MSNQKVIASICLIYIIVYVVIKVWFNPNYEPFSQGEKIVRIRDVIASNGLVEVTFRKPILDEGDEIVRYEIIINNDKNVFIGKKILTEYLGQDLVKYTINDNVITDNTDYVVAVNAITKNNKTILSVPFKFRTSEKNRNIIKLNEDIMDNMDENRKIFLQQETEQNTQNRIITDLKKRVDSLRNDIVLLKTKDKNELRSIQDVVQRGDSVAQVLGMGNGTNGFGNAAEMLSKNYNVNLNLE